MQFSYVKLICALAVIFDGTGRCDCEEVYTSHDYLVTEPTLLEFWDNIPRYTCSVLHNQKAVASGIILTERHVLTTCKTVITRHNKVIMPEDVQIVRGIFNEEPEAIYMDKTLVKSISPHPQCIEDKFFDISFNLAIIETKAPMMINQLSSVADLTIEKQLRNTNKPWFLSNFRADNNDATIVNESVWMIKSSHVDDKICQDPAIYNSSFNTDYHFCSGYYHGHSSDRKCTFDVGSSIAYEGTVIGMLTEKVDCGGAIPFAKFINIGMHRNWIDMTFIYSRKKQNGGIFNQTIEITKELVHKVRLG